jgi:hypothetical protein
MPMNSPPAPIPPVSTIDEVVEAIDSVINWSIGAADRMGYFAALYKRITIAVRAALAQGAFQDGQRLERLDVAFAARYLNALNGWFHPGDYPKPSRCWRVTFDQASRAEPILLQHMLGGVNAHIALDLGIAVQTISVGARLSDLHADFDTINAVLASQVNGVVDEINELSPALADLYAALAQNEIFLINEGIRQFRDSAWRFATILAAEPGFARPATIWVRDGQVATQAQVLYDPPGLIGLGDSVVRAIAASESRDVVKNIQVLDEIASAPAPIHTAL